MGMNARPAYTARLLALMALLLSGTLVLGTGGNTFAAVPEAALTTPAGTTAAPTESPTGRWIVRLNAPPLAQAPITRPEFAAMDLPTDLSGKLDLSSAAAQQYRSTLAQQQNTLFQAIQSEMPGAQLQQRYQVVLNGLAVALPQADAAAIERLRAMPQVAEVYPDQHYDLQMFSSLNLINAPALWETVGGQPNAGAGIKIAVLDSGIKIDNPFFDPAGFSYPEGYPRGDTAHTTPKVIVARTYIRPGAPPLEGSDTPQPGPLDASHGTHVAGIAAGVGGTQASLAGVNEIVSGVAPRAYLMNYKVFYANESIFSGAFSIELIAAMEDAVTDGADIINNSWGGRAGEDPRFYPVSQAAEAAVDAGVTVVFAGGNEGPDASTAGSPAYSEKVISVGAVSKSQIIAAGFIDVVAPEGVPEDLVERRFAPAAFGAPIADNIVGPSLYLPIAALDETGLACDPLPADTMNGQIALVERGVCEFSLKAFHVQEAGASAAIIYNSEAGGETLVQMAPGARAAEVTIPTVFVARSTGLGMLNWIEDTSFFEAQVKIDPTARLLDVTPDVLAEFSSRGPTFQGSLKPDIVAPGDNILSAGNALAEGIEQHLGFGISSGTSMAAPHVAGAAAVLKQLHPDWSPADIKSALMSTAVPSVWLDEDQTQAADVLAEGAGRIDLSRAGDPGLLFDRPGLSFGRLAQVPGEPTRAELTVQARNITNEVQTYALSTDINDSDLGVSVTPASITLGPQEQASMTVALEIPAGAPARDYGGAVELSGPRTLRLPIWARTLPAEQASKVLLIDNDGSTSLGLTDYSGYYVEALRELTVSTTYLDVDALAPAEQTLPSINELQQYEIIIWFTGDNFVPSGALPVPTPLTPADQNILIAYLQAGGNLIATGQDLTDASDIAAIPPDERYGRSDLYHSYLGIRFVQDAVFSDTQPLEPLVQGMDTQPWAEDIVLNLSQLPEETLPSTETGASNQEAVDEVSLLDADPRIPPRYTTPILRAVNAGEQEGIVGVVRSAEPTLEQPGLGLPYRSSYLTFGLEGVRSDTGTTTRKELLQELLWWHVDSPAVTLPDSVVTTSEPNQRVTFTAEARSNTPTEFVRYRWSFGDGSAIVETSEPQVTHQYNAPGTYQAQVEVTNSWGHRALSPLQPLGPSEAAAAPATPQMAARTFPETGQTLQGRFLEFWQQHGGLAVFGYPTTPQQEGETLRQQFERTRFELHPENAPPYDVLLGRVGAEALAAQGRDWRSFPTVEGAPEGCLYFAETQHSLCGAFLERWQSSGLEFDGQPGSSYAESLALFGLPLSEPQQETLEDGSVRTVQWFERARFELHPENAPPYDVLLGLLGGSAR
jgi:subtilisin family serine protease